MWIANCGHKSEHFVVYPPMDMDANGELIYTEIGILVELDGTVSNLWADGTVSNLWADGTVGVAAEIKMVAEMEETAHCPECYLEASWKPEEVKDERRDNPANPGGRDSQ